MNVTVYQNAHFQGNKQELEEGLYKLSDLNVGSNTINSMRVPAGMEAIVYENEDFSGVTKRFIRNSNDLEREFKNKRASLVIKKAVAIFQERDCKGYSQTLSVGKYNIGDLFIGSETLSSLTVPEGMEVTLYENMDFTGRQKKFTKDTNFVGEDFDNQTSSIEVKQYISIVQLDKIIREQLDGKLSLGLKIYYADGQYYCPSVSDTQNVIEKTSVNNMNWTSNRFDCDDFSIVLKAEFAKDAYKNGERRAAHCFGIVWGMLPGAHAINWVVNDDLVLRLVEPQNDQIFRAQEFHKDIWFMLC